MTISTRLSSPQSLYALFVSLAVFVLFFTTPGNAKAQNPIHASTSASQAPGAPAGSYALTGFENVNLYNGHLNFHLPLLSVKGRGETGYTITLPIESRWVVEGTAGVCCFTPSFNWWTGIKPGYSPGVLQGRQVAEPCNWGVFAATDTGTRLTFTTNDGTEYELLDTQHGGNAASSDCNQFEPGSGMASRGDTFVSIDGTSATFKSDTPIFDNIQAGDSPLLIYPTGNLFLANGTRYRISNGRVVEMRDRNGNVMSFEYEREDFTARVISIKDSLERQVSITYATPPSVTFDQITFKGFDGTQRSIKIERTNLGNVLMAGESVSSYQTLFPQLTSQPAIHNPEVVASVTLPNQKSYSFKYNRYAELARVDLPTGGRFEYSWGSGHESGDPSGTNGSESEIVRRITERREYLDSTTLAGKISFGRLIRVSPFTEGSVLVKSHKPNNDLLTQDKHYFKIDTYTGGLFGIHSPLDGREFKTESLALNGSVLRTVTHNWATGGTFFGFPKNPHITETVTTLNDANLVSKQTFLYDDFNNRTDTYEFDFGVGSPGARRRHTRISYLNSSTYTNANVHLRNLITQVSVFDGPDGAEKERLRTVNEYDDYSNTTNHAPLKSWQAITGIPMTGHNSSFDTSYLTRGNVTKTTQFLLVADPNSNPAAVQGSVSGYNQYDLAGNVVRTIDALGNASDIEYVDRFGSPDGNAQSNTGPSHLNSPTLKYTYAFPTKVTNAVSQITYSQFDYHLGKPVDVEDLNGVVSSSWYGDSLDRTTQVILANNQNSSYKNQITFTYDDTARSITRKSSKDVWNDGLLTTQTRYDGLGRTIEQRMYESVSNFIATQTEYDALGRPFRTSTPFRQNETPSWTVQTFDALGRVTAVTTTADNAVVTTSYSGNTVTATDQAGRSRRSVADALGRLIEVYEDPTVPGGPTELNYQTSYSYDTRDNLVKVTQGSQERFFMYDSLNRLIRSQNPEQGTLAGLSLADPLTGNSAWSFGYQYDANSNLTQKTDARGVVSTYVYDALNRNTTIDHSDTATINPDVTRVYDGALLGKGQLWKSYAGGTESNGSNVEKTVVDSYDPLGRPLVLNQSFKLNNTWKTPYQTTRTYNVAGAVTSQTYPSGHFVTYNYDNAGRLADKDVSNLAFAGNLGRGGEPLTYASGNTYSSRGGLTIEQFGTQTPLYHKLQYNSRGQLWDVRVATGADVNGSWNRGALQFFYDGTYGFGTSGPDNNGNVLKSKHYVPLDESSSTWVIHDQLYTYDSLNRLASVAEYYLSNTQPAPQQSLLQSYTYDRYGNRTINAAATWLGNQNNPPNPLLNETQFDVSALPSTNRLLAPGDPALAENQRRMRYDNAGNLINDTYTGAGARVYDADNRMISAWGGDNQWQYYTYNADGQRTRRKINNQETWQIYGFDGELLAEYPADGAANKPVKEYGYRNGELLITATPGSGSDYYSLSLNGTNAYAQVPNSTSLNITGAITVEAWIKPNSIGTYQYIASRETYGVAGTGGGYELTMNNVGKVRFDLYHSPTTYTPVIGNTVLTTGNWHHIAGVWDGTHMRLYVNGALDATTVTGNGPASGTSSVKLGRNSGGGYFNGLIDEVRVSNAAVYASNFTPQTHLTATANTRGLWKFDGEVVTDSSANGNNGTLQGATYSTDVPGGGGGTSAQLLWLVADHLGTPRIIVDETGNRANVKRHDYLPFGEELYAGTSARTTAPGYAGDSVRQQFTSKERDDETGLDYFLARYYSSTQGRFISVDPENAGAYPGEPQSWNGYSYARNNPLMFVDPDGLDVQVTWNGGGSKTFSDVDFERFKRILQDQGFVVKKGNIYAPVMDDEDNVIGYRPIATYVSDCLYCEEFVSEMSKRAEPLHTAVTVGAIGSTIVIAAPIVALEVGAAGVTTVAVAGIKATHIAAKRLRNLKGMSRMQARDELKKLGFKRRADTKGGYEQWRHPDGSQVHIRPNGEVVRTAPRQWASDGSGKYPPRIGPDGEVLPFKPGGPNTHNTGEIVH